ncbi:MAG TPA: serpin family protein, partial [Defluviitaleaceae bacterium]|nr:serpin family protein [Defluviitaleaceae bacterium]
MKKITRFTIIVLTLISFLAGCTKRTTFEKENINSDIINHYAQFSFEIFSKLNEEDSDKNVIISPLSISCALSMALQGAGTTTKDSMMKTLKYEEMQLEDINTTYMHILDYLEKADNKIKLDINNSIWIRKGKGIKEEFINVNKDVFKAYVTELDFSDENATTQINQWVADSTNNKIKQIIQPPIAPNTAMYLINAIYFKGEWTDKFDKRDTFAAKFYSGNGETREVMMMSKKDEIEYGEGDDFKVVRLPYGEEKVSMYCILPAENIPINDFIKELDSNKWEEIKNSVYARKDLYLNIPRFKIEYGIKNLNNCLIAMGMEEAFLQDKADFSG